MSGKSFARLSLVLGGACAALAMSASASAQAAPATMSPLAWSKSDAILEGPSALTRILQEQRGGGAIATRPPLRPAALSLPVFKPTFPQLANRTERAAVSGEPDLFGSVALAVRHTPLDSKWRSVANSRVTGEAGAYAESLRDLPAQEQLAAVNRYVNRHVRYVDDQRRFGKADVWSTAQATLRAGRGDCEDYAIAKLQMLRRAGFNSRDLYFVLVHDPVRRADHAVLVARAAGRMLVLDDGTDAVLDQALVSDYRPVLTFASTGEWTHGYAIPTSPPINVAAAGMPSDLSAAPPQRSRSASLLAFNTGFSR